MLEFCERQTEKERQHEYRITQLFSSFSGANARYFKATSTPFTPGRFCTNTQQPARPFSLSTQQPMSMALMFQSQNTDFARSMESLYTKDPYQSVNSPPNHINKFE